ncbi:hypothetical protein ACP4OV_005409 [Aristida adscensionis]
MGLTVSNSSPMRCAAASGPPLRHVGGRGGAHGARPAMAAERRRPAAALWGHGHLPLLARAHSKDSVEYLLQALWRTRRTGLDAADRAVARDILQLPADADLDPLLVCLRILIRRCVSEGVAKDDIPKLFPEEVPPELQKLLTLLLQKFQPEWQEDASKDQASAPQPAAAECQPNQNGETSEQPAADRTQHQNGATTAADSVESGEKEVKRFPLAKDSLDRMLKDLFPIKDQMPNADINNGHEDGSGDT